MTYEVQVQAINDEGPGAWSPVGTATAMAAANERPVAVDDRAETDEEQGITIDVLANDTDGNGNTLVIAGVSTQPANGAATIENGTILYTPNPDFNGEDRFTYRVSDRTGTANALSAPGTVTVNAMNDAPEAVGAIPDLMVSAEGDVDVAPYFTDRDDDALTYTAVSSDPAVAEVSVSGSTVTITPLANEGETRITVTAWDRPEGDPDRLSAEQSFAVTVFHAAAERINRVIATVLPEDTRARVAGTVGAVAGRIEADEGARSSGAPPSGRFSLAGSTTLHDALRANGQALEDGTLDVERVLAGSSFTLPLGAAGGGDAGPFADLALWGNGDWRSLSGGDSSAVEWEGEVTSAYFGADTRLREDLLAGLAVSWSRGSFDYTDHTDGKPMSGAYESRLTSLNPYLGWKAQNGLALWATAGYGWGEAEIDDEQAHPETSDLAQWSAAAGASGLVWSSDVLIEGGTTQVKLKGEAWAASAEVKDAGLIERLSVDVSRLRLALEGSHEHKLAAGGTLTPAIELGLRKDGGDGETGTGVELGGSLRYRDPATGLTVRGHGRALLTHSGDTEEWDIGGLVRLDPGAEGRGLSLSLVPAMGATGSGVERLWNDGVSGLAAANDSEAQSRLQAELGYGFGVLGGHGVLTPYGGLSLVGEGARRYTLGTRLEITPALDLSLEGERREAANDAEPDHGIMLRGKVRF